MEKKKNKCRVNSNDKGVSTISFQKYAYAPLTDPEAHIRLLSLRPAPDSTWPLRCSIFYTPLSNAPPYTALSYTWGERSSHSHVLIDGHHVSITPNLKNALTRLRKTDEEVLLWADALCINQEDIEERNIQTTKMREVYLRAESVAVWLGTEYSFSQGALSLVRKLNKCDNSEDARALVLDPEMREKLVALVVLFRRQYWWRIWVIQEVACAKRAFVYVGNEEISWTDLDGVCEILKTIEGTLHSLFYKRPSYVRTLTHGGPRGLQLSRYNPTLAAPPLLELMLTHKSKKSTDPKDKVFALVGISSSRHTFGDIDYSLSMRETYTHTIKHIISTSQKLDVICVKQNDLPRFNLPSWAPDWTRPRQRAGATMIGLHHCAPGFAAAGDSMAQVNFTDEGEEGDYILHTKGIPLDTIITLGTPYKKLGAPSEVAPALEAFHSWWSLFVSTLPSSCGSNTTLPSTPDLVRFGSIISCGTWNFPTPVQFTDRLEAIFSLSSDKMSDSTLSLTQNGLATLSRESTMSATMTSSINSISSLTQTQQADEDEELIHNDEEDKESLSAIISASLMMNRRRFFATQSGVLGLAPWDTEVGDEVMVLFGCKFPVVVRRAKGECGRYTLVGEAYVEGFMHGEAIAGLNAGRFEAREIDIC